MDQNSWTVTDTYLLQSYQLVNHTDQQKMLQNRQCSFVVWQQYRRKSSIRHPVFCCAKMFCSSFFMGIPKACQTLGLLMPSRMCCHTVISSSLSLTSAIVAATMTLFPPLCCSGQVSAHAICVWVDHKKTYFSWKYLLFVYHRVDMRPLPINCT